MPGLKSSCVAVLQVVNASQERFHTGEAQGYPVYSKWKEGTCIKLVNITSTFRVNEHVFIWSGKVKYAIDFGIIAITIVLCLFTVPVAIIIKFHVIISVVPQELYDVQSAYCIAWIVILYIYIYIYMYRETAWYHAVLYNMHINYHGTFPSYVVCANKWWHQYIVLHKLRIETQHA